MEQGGTLREQVEIRAAGETYLVSLYEQDLGQYYPGMIRYTVEISREGRMLARFRTNTYEYSPGVQLDPGSVARKVMARWGEELRSDPGEFLSRVQAGDIGRPRAPGAAVVIIQGSPRPDGNCATLSEWAANLAGKEGKEVQVIYPHDLDIRSCIGCYQCYNTGACTFADDMAGIIDAISVSDLLVICSPVYTNTVPAGLKLVIDRCQALHAEQTFHGGKKPQKGLLLGVAGRRGEQNFECVTRVVEAFFRHLGMKPVPPLLIDRVDEIRDVKKVPGLEERLRSRIQEGLLKQ